MKVSQEASGGSIKIEMTQAEWNDVLKGINHSVAYQRTSLGVSDAEYRKQIAASRAAFKYIVEFRKAVQAEVWKA